MEKIALLKEKILTNSSIGVRPTPNKSKAQVSPGWSKKKGPTLSQKELNQELFHPTKEDPNLKNMKAQQ